MNFTPPIHYTPQNPFFRELIKDKMSRQHFMMHNNLRLITVEPGYSEVEAELDTHLQQQDGFVHGGVTSTISDIVTGFAAFSLVGNEDRVVTSNLNVSYFKPGKGEKVFARGWVVKPGSRLHYCEAEVYVLSEKVYTLIAKATSIMAVILGKNK